MKFVQTRYCGELGEPDLQRTRYVKVHYIVFTRTCEDRETFSGHTSMLKCLYSNSTANGNNVLLLLHRKIYTCSEDTNEKLILVFLFISCVSWAPGREFWSELTSNWEETSLNILHQFSDVDVTCSSLPSPHCFDMLLHYCSCHFRRYQTNSWAFEEVIVPAILHAPSRRTISMRHVKSWVHKACNHNSLHFALTPPNI